MGLSNKTAGKCTLECEWNNLFGYVTGGQIIVPSYQFIVHDPKVFFLVGTEGLTWAAFSCLHSSLMCSRNEIREKLESPVCTRAPPVSTPSHSFLAGIITPPTLFYFLSFIFYKLCWNSLKVFCCYRPWISFKK